MHYEAGDTFVAEDGTEQTVVAVHEGDESLYMVRSEDGTVGITEEPDVLSYSWRKCQSD